MMNKLISNVANNTEYTLNDKVKYDKLIIKSINIPAFNNVSASLITNTIIEGLTTYTIDEALYAFPNDLITAINTQFGAIPGSLVLTILNQRITIARVGGGGAFITISNGRLINDILGFAPGQINGTANTYTATYNINLFPWANVVVDSDLNFSRYGPSTTSFAYILPNQNQGFIYSVHKESDFDEIMLTVCISDGKPLEKFTFRFYVMFYDETLELIDLQTARVAVEMIYI